MLLLFTVPSDLSISLLPIDFIIHRWVLFENWFIIVLIHGFHQSVSFISPHTGCTLHNWMCEPPVSCDSIRIGRKPSHPWLYCLVLFSRLS